MNLGKNGNNPSGEFLIVIAIICVTRLKIGLIEKMQKMTLKLHKKAYPVVGNPLGSIPNVSELRCYQNLSNTVYRIEIVL